MLMLLGNPVSTTKNVGSFGKGSLPFLDVSGDFGVLCKKQIPEPPQEILFLVRIGSTMWQISATQSN